MIVTSDDAGSRLDTYLAREIDGWSRSRLQRLIDEGDVLVNGVEAKASYKLHDGDDIEVELTDPADSGFEPEEIPLDIVFEDDDLAVINKPAGLIVHPGAGVAGGTLANAIAWHFGHERVTASPDADPKKRDRVGIVHRLDKDTSGLIVVAKHESAAEELSRQFHDREVAKSYIALVHGTVAHNRGTIDRPIARDRYNRTRMTIAASGRNAVSMWKIRARFEKFTLLDVEIKTGRTHQIRVHLASINHPVVGDSVYNEGRDNTIADPDIKRAVERMNRFFLHSQRLSFTHPKTGERMEFFQELPPELARFLTLL